MISPIFENVVRNDIEGLRRLLLDQPNLVNARSDCDWTPLHRAVGSSRLEIAKLLLECGANVNALGRAAETPLHLADNIPMVRLLLLHGADPRKADRNGMTPIYFAEAEGNSTLAGLLGEAISQLELLEAPVQRVSPN